MTHPPLMTPSRRAAALGAPLIAAALLLSAPAAAVDFAPPVPITDGARNYQFARVGGGNAAFDSTGQLHVAYWAGAFATSTTTPSRIYHQRWSPGAGWSSPLQLDENALQGGQFVGGRHPGLAIAPDNTAWVAWQDHRHSGEAGNFINNQEIYIRPVSAAGVAGTEVRLTTTTAVHFGDNGYAPRVAAHADGRLAVLWYDFNANATRADLYIARSDTAGAFDLSGGLASQRLTLETDRPAGSTQTYGVPDLAVGTTGTEVAAWTEGLATGGPLLSATVPDPTALIPLAAIQTVATETGSYFTPGRVVASPDGGFWAVYTDTTTTPRTVRVARRAPASTTFAPSVEVVSHSAAHAEAADVAVDGDGVLHLAWIERPVASATQRAVRQGAWDPASPSPIAGVVVTPQAGEYERVSIALDPAGQPHLLFDERVDASTGQIWFVAPAPATRVGGWMMY